VNKLSEVGRAAAWQAMREALLAALERNRWALAYTARELGMGDIAAPVVRAIQDLDLVTEYEAAMARDGLERGGGR
jgi:transcriptional regulator with GAF, ATPase, and Fis domain